MLRPLQDYVVLEKVKEEEKTQSGIILTTKEGKLVPIDLEKGSRVIYKKYSGTEVKDGKEEYLLIKAEDILAVVE